MSPIWTIAKRELNAYFVSPIAYVYLITFLVFVHWFFFRGFFLEGQTSLRSLFQLVPWVFLFLVPATAMGKWSEEKKTGTIELLFTFPLKDIQVVLGKFLAGLSLVGLALFLTFPLPLTVSLLGTLDFGPIIGGYLGLLLLGGSYLAIGLWVSALTENQIIAFIVGLLCCFALFMIGEPLFTTGLPPILVAILQNASLSAHFQSIGRGIIDSRDILYYFSVIFFFLFLNLKVVEKRT